VQERRRKGERRGAREGRGRRWGGVKGKRGGSWGGAEGKRN